MKTESERLKENTDAQYRKERFEELQQYIDALMLEADIAFNAIHSHFKLEMLALVTWIVALVTIGDGIIESFAWGLWFGLAVFDWFIYQPRLTRSLAKLDSCFETLRILGLLNKDNDNGKRKLKRFRDNPIERLWAKIKRQKQEEVYGTA